MTERENVALSRVGIEQLRRYLRSAGWLAASPSKPDLPFDLFRFGEVYQLLVPKRPDETDAAKRIRDALRTLSDIQEKSLEEVADAVISVGYDVLRSAVPSAFVRDESIQLSAAASFVSEMKELLASAASTEINPIPYFDRVRKVGLEYADRCRFGHTFKGSFGFIVESPLPTAPMEAELFQESPLIPLERRVVQRFANGIKLICQAASAQSIDPVTNGVQSGFNANGCEQFADLIAKVSPGGLSIQVDFSSELAVQGMNSSEHFEVGAQHIEIARQAAVSLRRNEIALPVKVAGRTIRLQNQTDPSDLGSTTGEHEIVVLWSSEDLGDIQVRINLTPQDYLTAVAAHGSGRPINVNGTLTRRGRKWALLNPQSFSVLQQRDLPFEPQEDLPFHS